MKIRTVEQLLDRVDQDRVWRIREIVALTRQCELKNLPPQARSALRKSFLTMLYAHWEGFVKNAADSYLEFVAMQGLRMEQISTNFLSIYFRAKYNGIQYKNNNSSFIDICNSIYGDQKKVIKIEHKNVLSSYSNLNYDILEEISLCIGVEMKEFESKRNFINSRLVGRRNKIAHGNHEIIEEDEIDEMRMTVVSLIDTFKAEVENAAIQKSYMRQ